jgi:hypothetical protein
MIKHLLYKIPFILLLPDNERDTVAMGSLLRPLFTLCINSNISDTRSALQVLILSEKFDINKIHFIYQQGNQVPSSFKRLSHAA